MVQTDGEDNTQRRRQPQSPVLFPGHGHPVRALGAVIDNLERGGGPKWPLLSFFPSQTGEAELEINSLIHTIQKCDIFASQELWSNSDLL